MPVQSGQATGPVLARQGAGLGQLWHDVKEQDYPELKAQVARALDAICDSAPGQSHTKLARDVMDLLQTLKESSSDRVWQAAILPEARAHRMMDVVQQDPFTHHSFTQPRGYPGDADLIDLVYMHADAQPAIAAATPEGRSVFDVTVNVSACAAVRRRKDILAAKIDEIADLRPNPEVLVVACGNLREAETSVALREGRVGHLLATDQDKLSLAKAAGYKETISDRIDTANISARQFIIGRHGLGQFDLVYAAGLYDYLDARIASRLTSRLFSLLKPGGRLLIPNFRTGVPEEAYMEVYMDWYLIYRSRAEIEAFAEGIPRADIAKTSYFEDETGIIGYLELERA